MPPLSIDEIRNSAELKELRDKVRRLEIALERIQLDINDIARDISKTLED